MEQLTEKEVAVVREVIPHMEAVIEQQKFIAARRLVFSTYRKAVIGVAGVLGALIVLRNNLGDMLKWLIGT